MRIEVKYIAVLGLFFYNKFHAIWNLLQNYIRQRVLLAHFLIQDQKCMLDHSNNDGAFFCENSSVTCHQFRKKAPSHMYK